jgi:hypothetical protein
MEEEAQARCLTGDPAASIPAGSFVQTGPKL